MALIIVDPLAEVMTSLLMLRNVDCCCTFVALIIVDHLAEVMTSLLTLRNVDCCCTFCSYVHKLLFVCVFVNYVIQFSRCVELLHEKFVLVETV